MGPTSGDEPPYTTSNLPPLTTHATCEFRGGGLGPEISSLDHSHESQSSTTTSLKHVPCDGSCPPKTYTLRPTAVAVAPVRAGSVPPPRTVVLFLIHRQSEEDTPSVDSGAIFRIQTSSNARGDRSVPPMNRHMSPTVAEAHPPLPLGCAPRIAGRIHMSRAEPE